MRRHSIIFLLIAIAVNGCAKKGDWKFPAQGIPSKQSNGMTVYDLGDGFNGIHTQSPKKGHMVSVSVPASFYEKARRTSSDDNEISKLIAWQAFRRASYPQHDDMLRDYIGSTGKETMPAHMFRTSKGDAMYVVVLVGNNALFSGSMAMISKEPPDNTQ